MIRSIRTSRRMVLQRMLWAASGALLPFHAFSSRPQAGDIAASALIDSLQNPASARVIGAAYLRIHPAERSSHVLVERVFQQDEMTAFLAAGARRRRALLRARVREDFVTGRLIEVRGWILSETEARVCALAALR